MMTSISFPSHRARRMRKHPFLRNLMRENQLSVNDLIYPVFIAEGKGQRQVIPSMPGIYRFSPDTLLEELKVVADLGIPMVTLFPQIPQAQKSLTASHAHASDGLVPEAIACIKAKLPELGVMSDVALDPYTTHGQDGIVDGTGYILNDETVEILVKQALSHASAGVDVVAPSDMMDGRIGAIRQALDISGYNNTCIMSYAAKYASSLYSPFRDAIGSSANLGGSNKFNYQMDIANSDEAMREVTLDIQEGADMVMVKPGLPYLDIVHRVKQTFVMPTYAYHVSGEYAMLKAAVEQQWLDEKKTVMECLVAFKRAGADGILTYYAKQAAEWLKQ